jgi:hypothetical protein
MFVSDMLQVGGFLLYLIRPKQTADGPFTVAVHPSEETGSFSITQSNPGEERVMIL